MLFTTLVDVLRHHNGQTPNKVVYRYLREGKEVNRLTFGQLFERASLIAHNLREYTQYGDRVLLLYPHGTAFIEAFLGSLLAGVIAVPAYPPSGKRKLQRLEKIVEDCSAKLVLGDDASTEKNKKWFAESDSFKSVQFISTEQLQAIEHQELPEIKKEAIAFLQYTSGSTGHPKGVVVTHENILHNLQLIQNKFGLTEEYETVGWLPVYHDMGLIGIILEPLFLGICCHLMDPTEFIRKPLLWLQAIANCKSDSVISGGPDFAYNLCVDQIEENELKGLNLKKWKRAFNGAEPVRSATLDRFKAKFKQTGFEPESLKPCYGMAETTLIVSAAPTDKKAIEIAVQTKAFRKGEIEKLPKNTKEKCTALVSSGSASDGLKVKIVDPVTCKEIQNNSIGEVWVQGTSVAQGYWNNPTLTEATFKAKILNKAGKVNGKAGSFLRTGDYGFIDRGALFVTGRLKELIIVNGANHFPQDLEQNIQNNALLIRHGGAAFGVEVEGKERLVIAQEIKRTHVRDYNAAELFEAIQSVLNQNHALSAYDILLLSPGSIPKTSSGKIKRTLCKSWYETNTFKGILSSLKGAYAKSDEKEITKESIALHPKSMEARQIEQWLVERLTQLKPNGTQEVKTKQSFASMGLTSVDAIRLTGQLGEWMETEISPTVVYDYPNIASLATFLSEGEKLNSAPTIEERIENEPIAIIGMAAEFPKAKNYQQFWELIRHGGSGVELVDSNAIARAAFQEQEGPVFGGFLEGIDTFDAEFFGISPREAKLMDPQQRLVLHTTVHAMQDANISLQEFENSNTGVFLGISNNDYAKLQRGVTQSPDVYLGTGNSFSIAANRISYQFNLKGPSMAIDTACSSSLVSIHTACNSLRNGECTTAIAGGVNLIVEPTLSDVFNKAGMLAPDGKCKTLDKQADGYVRGEGVGMLVLKPLRAALKDGNTIHAIVSGSAVNQDGKSNGLTAPNGPAQASVIQKALSNAGKKPSDIDCIELHGSGTALGDPIEVNTLASIFRGNKKECFIGTVKSNIGHLEAAAGIAGMIKSILVLKHNEIPKTLHFNALNPKIDLLGSDLVVTKENQYWNKENTKAHCIGVSSFGFGGTNAHVVLESYPQPSLGTTAVSENKTEVFTVSAQSETALANAIEEAKDWVSQSTLPLEDLCNAKNLERDHFSHRLMVHASSKKSLLSKLTIENRDPISVKKIVKTAFLFTGQGSQYNYMGKALLEKEPVFRSVLEEGNAHASALLGVDLLQEVILSDSKQLNETKFTQPALFIVEYALAKLYLSWGIEPQVLLGHSIGEFVAACLAGVFSLPDAIQLIVKRGELMQSMQKGGMVAVLETEQKVQDIIGPFASSISIAAVNGASNVVIAGPEVSLNRVLPVLKSNSIQYVALNVSHAFHSFMMEPAKKEFETLLKSIGFKKPTIPIISNLTGKIESEIFTEPEYWSRHLVETVRFYDGAQQLIQENPDAIVECGPKPVLNNLMRPLMQNLDMQQMASLQTAETDDALFYQNLARFYEGGYDLQWPQKENRTKNIETIPLYPFDKKSYWIEAPSDALIDRAPQLKEGHPLLGIALAGIGGLRDTYCWETRLDAKGLRFLQDHRAWGNPVMPHTAYVAMALAASKKCLPQQAIKIKNLTLHGPLFLQENDQRKLQVLLQKEEDGKFSFKVYTTIGQNNQEKENWKVNASAQLLLSE